MSHRRRALLLGGLALVLGGLAASNVAGREAALARRVGDLVDVVVAREPIAAGAPVRERALAVRRVPRRFAPAGAIASPQAVVGLRAAVDIAAGTDIAASMVGDGRAPPADPAIRRGERVARVVALASPELVTPGSHVDVLVTPEPREGASGEAVLALEDVEVLDAVPAA
ncbi:MAG: pilus assembly protein CpaB, partial [Solirubrobacteraceae bacterium]|nr:pilus assembly protein CpaB [Solirubrobacteraceae bacterium]